MNKTAIIAVSVLLVSMIGCSTKERESGDHALTDELEMIEKAEEAVELIESRGYDQLVDSVEGLEQQ